MDRARVYTAILREHFERNRQMAFVTARARWARHGLAVHWEMPTSTGQPRRPAHLAARASALAEALGLDQLREQPPFAVLDELHKFAKWKTLLKGFFDTYGERAHLLVTGSSRMDIYRAAATA